MAVRGRLPSVAGSSLAQGEPDAAFDGFNDRRTSFVDRNMEATFV